MKPYRILKTFHGSQTGHDGPHKFVEGTEARLSDWLAPLALREGWAEEATASAKEPESLGKPVSGPEARETKVEAPTETKPAKVKEKKHAKKGE